APARLPRQPAQGTRGRPVGRACRGHAPPARGPAAAPGGGHGGRLKFSHAALAAACCFCGLSCEGLATSATTPYAVVVVAPPDSMHVNDTVVIHARAINRSGDSIPGAILTLVSLDP